MVQRLIFAGVHGWGFDLLQAISQIHERLSIDLNSARVWSWCRFGAVPPKLSIQNVGPRVQVLGRICDDLDSHNGVHRIRAFKHCKSGVLARVVLRDYGARFCGGERRARGEVVRARVHRTGIGRDEVERPRGVRPVEFGGMRAQ